MSEHGLTPELLEQVVREFYATARQDALLGPVFTRVHDWEDHIARITAFWCAVALGIHNYSGRPVPAHMPLGLSRAHFARWFALWRQTVEALCPPAGAALLVDRAGMIGGNIANILEAHGGLMGEQA